MNKIIVGLLFTVFLMSIAGTSSGAVLSGGQSHHVDPLIEAAKIEYTKSMTLYDGESYLIQVIKIKKALNTYVSGIRKGKMFELKSIKLSDFIHVLAIENPKSLVSENIFVKDNIEISAEKSEKFELVVSHANRNQCLTLMNHFKEDKFTSYIVLNDELSNDVVCKFKDNTIRLSVF